MIRPGASWTARACALLSLALALSVSPIAQQRIDEDVETEPLDIGMVERTGIGLMFLDVLAVDKDGRPLPGLVKDDFTIKVNYLPREIYSVDNLCPCDEYGAELAVGQPLPNEETPAIYRSTPVYVLYFDFSQLQIDGRDRAIREAERWTREIMRPDDRVMVVGYSGETGVRTFTPLTDDRERVLQAIAEANDDPAMLDPFPSQLSDRMRMCADGDVSCYYVARREYMHLRHSYRALLNFITGLDEIPERKVMIFFHQNSAIFPGRLYSAGGYTPTIESDAASGQSEAYQRAMERAIGPMANPGPAANTLSDQFGGRMLDGSPSDLVPDLVRLVDQVGGTATASRTRLYPAVSGFTQRWTVNLGANLADFTGGQYNRGAGDLSAMLDDAARGCACIYRIGLLAPSGNKSKVFRTKVKVRGRSLPSRYRVQYLNPADRWMRKAQAVLSNPEEVGDVGIMAALVPSNSRDRKWKLSAQVAIDVNTLMRLQSGDEETGEWEIGALLADGKGVKTWEMLAVSRLRVKEGKDGKRDEPAEDGEEADAIILHQHAFDNLKPGRYELRAFVRDRGAGFYGGDRAEIVLPNTKKAGGLAGPVMLRPDAPHLRTALPIRSKKNADIRWIATLENGSLPLGDPQAIVGDEVEFLTLACPGRPRQTRDQLERSIVAEGATRLSLVDGEIRRAGDCVKISDRLDTSELAVGNYTYRVRWEPGNGQEPIESESEFEMLPAEEATPSAALSPDPVSMRDAPAH